VPIEISEFSERYTDAAVTLVVACQRDEFGFPVSAADQPDLLDVRKHYLVDSGNFWIALASDRLVGTIGLLDLGDGQASLRKMFVCPDFRSQGVASLLFESLLNWVVSHNFSVIYLGTTSKYRAAHRFYERHGFKRISETSLPNNFPRFDIEDRFYQRYIERGHAT